MAKVRKGDFWFCDSNYVWSHGVKPRGFGYWCFECNGHVFWAKAMMFAEAKKAAVSHYYEMAKNEEWNRNHMIIVCS